jgi:hypothetical protein
VEQLQQDIEGDRLTFDHCCFTPPRPAPLNGRLFMLFRRETRISRSWSVRMLHNQKGAQNPPMP